MSAVTHPAPRFPRVVPANGGPSSDRVRAAGQARVALLVAAALACVALVAVVLVSAGAGGDERIPHPVPLPAPTVASRADG